MRLSGRVGREGVPEDARGEVPTLGERSGGRAPGHAVLRQDGSVTEQLRQAVDAHGFVVVREPEAPGAPPASSTAGLTASGLPELVVLGLPAEVAHALRSM